MRAAPPNGSSTSSHGADRFVMRRLRGTAVGEPFHSPAPLPRTTPSRGALSVHRDGGLGCGFADRLAQPRPLHSNLPRQTSMSPGSRRNRSSFLATAMFTVFRRVLALTSMLALQATITSCAVPRTSQECDESRREIVLSIATVELCLLPDGTPIALADSKDVFVIPALSTMIGGDDPVGDIKEHLLYLEYPSARQRDIAMQLLVAFASGRRARMGADSNPDLSVLRLTIRLALQHHMLSAVGYSQRELVRADLEELAKRAELSSGARAVALLAVEWSLVKEVRDRRCSGHELSAALSRLVRLPEVLRATVPLEVWAPLSAALDGAWCLHDLGQHHLAIGLLRDALRDRHAASEPILMQRCLRKLREYLGVHARAVAAQKSLAQAGGHLRGG